ncbi:hypothetical protein N2152v2_003727 [Parachlorella kessleri]
MQVSTKGHAAVLIPLFEDSEGDVRVVLTQRSSKLSTHSGEVCLPGGKREPSDPDDIATALREANEELGLEPAAVNVVGRLPCFLSKHKLSVTPIVGLIPSDLHFCPNDSEVDSVFTAPLRMFLEGGPTYYSKDVEWQEGFQYRLHYWQYSHLGQSYLIWGLTAGILILAAERAFGRKPAFAVYPPGARPYTDFCWDGTRLCYRSSSGSSRGSMPGSPRAAIVAGERLLAQQPAAVGATLARRASMDMQQSGARLMAAYHTGAGGAAGEDGGEGAVVPPPEERGHWVENGSRSEGKLA